MNIEKVIKKIGSATAVELEALNKDALEERIVAAEQAMKQVQEELEANPKYQELKDSLKALREGKKEVDSRQKAVISYCLYCLESKGV